jgi:hypothetical protein
MTTGRCVIPVLAFVAAACSGGLSPDSRTLSGNVLLVRQLAENAAPVTGTYLSVVDSLALSITGGGTPQITGRHLGAGELSVTIPVTLPATGANLLVQIFSNSKRTLLFSGSASPTVDRDGFSVEVPLVAIRPVLVVLPDTVKIDSTVGTTRFGSVTVHNSGKDSLSWNVARDTTGTGVICGQRCTITPALSGKLAAGGDTKLVFRMPTFDVLGNSFKAGTMTYSVSSPEGTVTLPWRYPASPPVVILNITRAPH